MFHDFRLGSRLFAKCQNGDLGGNLGGDLGGNLGGVLRPDLFHGNRCQRNHGTEHIALDKFRGSAGVELCVFVSIPHPGPQLVCQSDLPEHFRDGWVLGIRLKGGQVQSAVSVGTIGVFRVEPVALNHKLCHIAAGKIPVRQAVGANLTQDAVSGADALDAFLHKGIAKVLLAESNQPVIGFQQVCDDNIPVIVAVHVFHPENGVCLVLRQHGQDGGVLAK